MSRKESGAMDLKRRLGAPCMRVVRLLVPGLLAATAVQADLYFATDVSLDASGVFIRPADVVGDPGAGPFSVDTSTGLPDGVGLNALHPMGSELLFVPRISVELPGALFASRRDVVRTNGSTWSLEFEGGAAGVPLDVAIDGVSRDGLGRLLLSFDTSVLLGGNLYRDDDVAVFDGVGFGPFFDGASESVPEALDVDGVHYDAAEDDLLLTFDAAGRVGGVDFAKQDVLRFDRATHTWSLELDGSVREPALAAADLVAVPEPGFGGALAVGVAFVSSIFARRRVRATKAASSHERSDSNHPSRRSLMSHRRSSIALLCSLTLLLVAGSGLVAGSAAAQGYIEINQAVVDAGGGFPYAITQPGLYRLTGNLTKTAGDGSVPAIEISADDVTLDLSGFSILAPGICARNGTSGVVTCAGHVPGSGIQESGGTNVTIRNGRVRGFFNGISLTATHALIEGIEVIDNAFVGLSAIGDGTTVRFVTALRNGTTGITVQNSATVSDCVASNNDDYGIVANLASSIVDNSVLGNRLGGMSLNSQASFDRNTVGDNFGPDPVFGGNDGGNNLCTNAIGTVVGC